MSHPTKNITTKNGARSTTDFVLGVVSPGLTLAKRPSESHHIGDYTHFIRTLARELARADHAAEDQSL
jgi:hypothetical protein